MAEQTASATAACYTTERACRTTQVLLARPIAGLSPWGYGGVLATPPLLPLPLALGHRGLGVYSYSAGPPASVAQLGIKWLWGQPRGAREPQERPRPAKRWPRALKGIVGQKQCKVTLNLEC